MNKKIIMPIISIAFATLTLGSNLHSFIAPSNKILLSKSNVVSSVSSNENNSKSGAKFNKEYTSEELKADKITPEIKSQLEEIFEKTHKIKIHSNNSSKGIKNHSNIDNNNK